MICESKLSILQCPTCKGDLSQDGDYLICVGCHSRFPVIDDIVVLLTRDDLADFLSEPWGSELQEEWADCIPGFASSGDAIEDLRRVHEGVTSRARARLLDTDVSTEDPGTPTEVDLAVDKTRDQIVRLSRAKSAKRILDWPTGGGACMERLASQTDPDALVVALDVDFRTMARIEPYYDEKGLSGKMLFVVADARRMPFKDGVFQSVTAWGGTAEIGNAEAGVKETYRVLESGGWFGITGDHYKENSPSMAVAERYGLDSVVTRARLEAAMDAIGFRNREYQVVWEGYDPWDNLPDEDRCPLPARGDWSQHIVASGQK